jgi:3-ketoacyl-CoA synthase
VYLVTFACYKPPERMRMSRARFVELSHALGAFNDKSLEFQEKMVMKGGLGDDTYLPDAMHATPPVPSMDLARKEAELVMFGAVEDALAEAGWAPSTIDAVVVNCSLFNPTPSLAAMLVNHFRMRRNVVAYNLGGMGCSAGVISVALARELLQTYPNFRVLIVSTENITQNWYFGNERSMLIPNCLFRVGGAALLLSNRAGDRKHAKYELAHVVRTHIGASDAAYRCVYQDDDGTGQVGVHLSKELMAIAGHALKANITALGPLVLPLGEKLKFAANLAARKLFKAKSVAPYTPDFGAAFSHFCIHTGGRGVIDEMEKQLRLSEAAVAPSRDTLHRYGNTSSSSVWYILARIESTTGVARGERVWQIAFGSGFKCNSAVWTALRTNRVMHKAWAPVDRDETEE